MKLQDLRLGSGEPVLVPENSHFHDHVTEINGELDHLVIALGQVQSSDADERGFIQKVIPFEDPVGTTNCVETKDGDDILFATRPKRYGPSRFVKNRQPEPCNTLVVVLRSVDATKASFNLITAFVGVTSKEPWDKFAGPTDKVFWANHALVWGTMETIPGSETAEVPESFRT